MIIEKIILDQPKVQKNYLKNILALAKEALSSGDKTLSENYFQHADHFIRVVDDKNKNRIQSKVEDKPLQDNNALSENTKSERR